MASLIARRGYCRLWGSCKPDLLHYIHWGGCIEHLDDLTTDLSRQCLQCAVSIGLLDSCFLLSGSTETGPFRVVSMKVHFSYSVNILFVAY